MKRLIMNIRWWCFKTDYKHKKFVKFIDSHTFLNDSIVSKNKSLILLISDI